MHFAGLQRKVLQNRYNANVDDGLTRKEQIYLTAGKLFSELGYHATSMRDLAKALGVQGGSLYAHIASKEELLWEIVNRAADEFDAALEPVRDSDLEPGLKLRAALEAHMMVIERTLDWATVFFHDWKHLSDDRLERIAARRDKIERVFRQILEEGVRKGVFRASLDVKLAAVLALSSANWAYHWFNPGGRFTAREVADAFAAMLLDGFRT
jgi:TetR/AcrR family transcriptional regulator, cholesterol catabolism regulator